MSKTEFIETLMSEEQPPVTRELTPLEKCLKKRKVSCCEKCVRYEEFCKYEKREV